MQYNFVIYALAMCTGHLYINFIHLIAIKIDHIDEHLNFYIFICIYALYESMHCTISFLFVINVIYLVYFKKSSNLLFVNWFYIG